jgi:hypothetical protein
LLASLSITLISNLPIEHVHSNKQFLGWYPVDSSRALNANHVVIECYYPTIQSIPRIISCREEKKGKCRCNV